MASAWRAAGRIVGRLASGLARRVVTLRVARGAALLVVSLAVAAPTACQGPAPRPPRTVFVVTIDTLRADHLGCYGYPRSVSPVLDRLAAEGARFARAFSSSATTAPSHASLFTGLHPAQHRVTRNGEALDGSVSTLGGVLQRQGYRTAGFTTTAFLEGVGSGFDTLELDDRYHPAGHVIDGALRWLDEHRGDERLMIWIHLFDVHEWDAPRLVETELLESTMRLEPSGGELLELLEASHGLVPPALGSRALALEAINRYDTQIRTVDREIGRLVSAVRERGLDEHSLWVVTSDHGEGLGSHRYKGHGWKIFNEQVHVPLIIRRPGLVPRGTVVEDVVGLVDVMPTVVALVGGGPVDQVFPVMGRSLVELMLGRGPVRDRAWAYSQARTKELRGDRRAEMYCLQSAAHKLIVRSNAPDSFFDLEADPLELRDLERRPSEIKDEMARVLDQMHREMGEQGAAIEPRLVSPEHVEQLKALGYSEPGAPEPRD